jgi:predicted secreted protein
MAEIKGSAVVISVGGDAVATARTKSLTINNSVIDITSDGDDGIRRILADPGQKDVDLSVEGLYIDTSFLDVALNGNLLVDVELGYKTHTISGDFFISTYSESMTYNDAVTFSATLLSSGAVVKGS